MLSSSRVPLFTLRLLFLPTAFLVETSTAHLSHPITDLETGTLVKTGETSTKIVPAQDIVEVTDMIEVTGSETGTGKKSITVAGSLQLIGLKLDMTLTYNIIGPDPSYQYAVC